MKTPSAIRVSTDKSTLSIHYAEGDSFSLSAEYLRVFSPSAEVRGHGRGQEVLQFGKRHVVISGLEKAGNYALRITFSDGHDLHLPGRILEWKTTPTTGLTTCRGYRSR